MRVAGFRQPAHAVKVAGILKDQGYDTELVGVDDGTAQMSDLPETAREAAWAKAFVLSNCDSDHFERIVVDNLGTVIWHRRPGRFRVTKDTTTTRARGRI